MVSVDAKLPPPEHLSEDARRIWERIVEENAIDAAAEPQLRILVDAWERREQARAAMKEKGPVIIDRFGYRSIPASTPCLIWVHRVTPFSYDPRGFVYYPNYAHLAGRIGTSPRETQGRFLSLFCWPSKRAVRQGENISYDTKQTSLRMKETAPAALSACAQDAQIT
jgi:hypothetical protein